MEGYNDISIELTRKDDGPVEIGIYRYKDKNRIKVDFKRLSADERKAVTKIYYQLFVQGSRKFAEISSI